jgi:hypothetical protein
MASARPEPIHPRPAPTTPKPKPGPKEFRVPGSRTPLTTAVDFGRAWGAALVAIAQLLTGRTVR